MIQVWSRPDEYCDILIIIQLPFVFGWIQNCPFCKCGIQSINYITEQQVVNIYCKTFLRLRMEYHKFIAYFIMVFYNEFTSIRCNASMLREDADVYLNRIVVETKRPDLVAQKYKLGECCSSSEHWT